jgi:hypothetical protein|nr:MAG TPA: hypothetical protein [Caudoviricetes sp.]
MKFNPVTAEQAREILKKAQDRDTQDVCETLMAYVVDAANRGLKVLSVYWGGLNSPVPHVEYSKIENGEMRIDVCGSHLVTHSDLINWFENGGFNVSCYDHSSLGRVIDVISWETK